VLSGTEQESLLSMKSSYFGFKRLFLLVLLIGSGIYLQEARSASPDHMQIALLSDIDASRFSQSDAALWTAKPAQGIDIDLTDSDTPLDHNPRLTKATEKSSLNRGSKLLILGGTAAFPI
jgi:hypothetical protein